MSFMFQIRKKRQASRESPSMKSIHQREPGNFVISNQQPTQKGYVSQINRELDPRDEVLLLPFQFTIILRDQYLIGPSHAIRNDQKITFLQKHSHFKDQIRDYLIESLETIISVSFNQLTQNRLTEREAKDYAAKNILLNCEEVAEYIEMNIEKFNLMKDEEQDMRLELSAFIDQTLMIGLENLAAYYPQATPTGATLRMRKELKNIDNRENQELDFLFMNDIIIAPRADKDYSNDIMNLLNKLISLSGQVDQNDQNSQTNYEKFHNFSHNLFWMSELRREKDLSQLLKANASAMLQSKINQFNSKSLISNSLDESTQARQELLNIQECEASKSKLKFSEEIINKVICWTIQKNVEEGYQNNEELEEKKQKITKRLKEKDQYQIGQKIPGNVKLFTEKEIRQGLFTIHHSSVLRILTKWAELLTQIFDDPTKHIKNRVNSFKTNNERELIFLNLKQKEIMCKVTVEMKEELKQYKEILIAKNKHLQSYFLFDWKENDKESEFIKRYTKTRITASKMTTILAEYMFSYVQKCIELLNQIPQKAQGQTQEIQSIEKFVKVNLISFKVGDLMRSKFHCSQKSFIDLLKLIYLLDEKGQHCSDPLFQLVRIKNKLDANDNNILINYVFMNKFQCELQVSLMSGESQKQKFYNIFAHFLYELSRGQFGVLSECATIIGQIDPLMSKINKQFNYYTPIRRQNSSPLSLDGFKHQKNIQTFPFICQKCKKLEIIKNPEFYTNFIKLEESCRNCTLKEMKEKQKARAMNFKAENEVVKKIFENEEHISEDKFNPRNRKEDENKLGIYIGKNQKHPILKFFITIFNPIEKCLYLYSEGSILFTIDQHSEQLSKITDDYFYQVRNPQNMNKILGENKRLQKSFEKLTKVDYKDVQVEMMEKQNLSFMVSELEKKKETLNLTGRVNILQKFTNSLNSINDSKSFRREEHLIKGIKFLILDSTQLTEIPSWLILTCRKLKELNLSNNNLQMFRIADHLALTSIIITNNQLTSVEIEGLPLLKKIHLRSNRIMKIHLDESAMLEDINLERNHLSQFECKEWPGLKKLNLAWNQFHEVGLRSWPSLESINLSHNKFEMSPLKQWPNIECIELSQNLLSGIEVTDYPKLKVLNVARNRMIEVILTNLPSLIQVDMAENLFSEIQITNCALLESLQLSGNQMTTFKKDEFPNLKTLLLKQNNICTFSMDEWPNLNVLNIMGNELSEEVKRDLVEYKVSHPQVHIEGLLSA